MKELTEIRVNDDLTLQGKILFRIPFTIYFVVSIKILDSIKVNKLCLALTRKEFSHGKYYWVII
jgi:hypothetical protein